jgi:beta-hydroxyacyl-ACP dehydratase FabZ
VETKDILNKIPHNHPFVFIDKALHINEGEEGVGLKNVTVNEPYFRGHFPDNPVLPGVFIVEAMAQLGGLVIGSKEGESSGVLGAVQDMRFLKPVVPGDQLVINVKVDGRLGQAVRFSGEAQVGREVVARGTFTIVLSP